MGDHADQLLEQTKFPHLNPGGVCLCEDIHGELHRSSAYINGLSNHLNTSPFVHDYENAGHRMVCESEPIPGNRSLNAHLPLHRHC